MTQALYRLVKAPNHPRATANGFVYEHVLVAEKVLGRYMPDGAEVHHVDANKRNNANENLVICQDHAFHLLLHQRQRALDACGNASWLQCCYCHKHDEPNRLTSAKSGSTGRRYYHPACAAQYVRERKARIRGENITREDAEAHPDKYLAMGQPWLYTGALP
jgi:hypothetical protein